LKVNPYIFRGYDLRGLVGEDLSPELALHLGRAFGTYLTRRGIREAVVGRDCRETSPEYSRQLIKGLNEVGVDVVDIGMLLVGMFYWSQYFLKRRGGVYVSASHNPPEYNGFKFANDYSETLVSDGMQELRRLVEQDDYDLADKPAGHSQRDIRQDYYDDIIRRLKPARKLKVLIDPSNTTGGDSAPELFRQAGCEVIERNCKVDPSFPLGIADPTESRVVERLSREVVEAGADVGFTFDSDGDRIGIVDEKGGIIWNDVLLEIFVKDVLKDHPGATIMYNILCSKAVKETILAEGGQPFMWRVGHSFLKKKNQEVKAAFIGELSGHFFFSADFHNHDDGYYSAMRLVRYLARGHKTLSQEVAELPHYQSSPEIKVSCPDEKKAEVIAELEPLLKQDYPQAEVVADERAGDGIRFELPDSMFVVRYSQNGPYLTIKFEAKSKERYEELRRYIDKLLHKYPEIDWKSKISTNVEALEEQAIVS
jgi:phosphomannomutase/phosphoglucomutase